MLQINRLLRTTIQISKFSIHSRLHSKPFLVRTLATMAAIDGPDGRVPYDQLAGRLKPQLLQALKTMEITHMSPVQEKVLSLPTFTQDCLVQAKTGTGKTIAFLLPALQTLLSAKDLDPSYVALLILAPTRELAQQIADECDRLTSACNKPFECHVAVGGSKKTASLNKFLRGKPTVLVATPGRLIDYLSEPEPQEKLSKVRCLVLDEADRMLDEGFIPDVMRILQRIPPKATAGWQGMCFSATVPPEINKVLHLVLSPDHARISTIDENEAPTIDTVPQAVFPVPSINEVLPTLHSVLSCAKADNPALKAVIFAPTARHTALLYHLFGYTGGAAPPKLPVFQMHSRMSQPQRTRTIDEFKQTDRGLLFASDVVGRGMDFPDINLVVQIGVPSEKDQYVHRVGRTGRAGKVGEAVMILTPEEMWFVKKNPEFPIKNNGAFQHPKAATYPSAQIIQTALAKIPDQVKAQAYVSNLGFTKSLMKKFGLQPESVVAFNNRFAESMGCAETPELSPQTVGKMGLRGVPGLVIEGKGLVTAKPGAAGARPGRGGGAGGRGGRGPQTGGREKVNGQGGEGGKPQGIERNGSGAGPRGGRGGSAGLRGARGGRPQGGDAGRRRPRTSYGTSDATGANKSEEPRHKRPRR